MQKHTGDEDWQFQLPIGDQTEPAAVKKVYFEQFRDCFLQLEEKPRKVLECKFGYDPYEPVLSCMEDYKSDLVVTKIKKSKPSIVRALKERGYEELRKKPFFIGYRTKKNQGRGKERTGHLFQRFLGGLDSPF